jgi:hypothetical protein
LFGSVFLEANHFCNHDVFLILEFIPIRNRSLFVLTIKQFVPLEDRGLPAFRTFDAQSFNWKDGLQGEIVIFDSRPNGTVRKFNFAERAVQYPPRHPSPRGTRAATKGRAGPLFLVDCGRHDNTCDTVQVGFAGCFEATFHTS